MGYTQPRRSGRRQLDSAELAVVIGGGALFMIGLVAVVLVVALRDRSSPAPVVALVPTQAQPASAPSQPAPAVATPSVSAPPPPAPSAAPPAKPSLSSAKLPDEAPVDQDENDDEEVEDAPETIDLRAPWSRGPGTDDRPGGDQGSESVSARLARQAQERAKAAREERRRREEERLRREEAAREATAAPTAGPGPVYHGPDRSRWQPRVPPPSYIDQSGMRYGRSETTTVTAPRRSKASATVVGLIIVGGGMFGLVIVCVEWFELLGVTIANYPFANFLYQGWRLLGGLQSVGLVIFGLFVMVAPFFMG